MATDIAKVKEDINIQLENQETMKSLMDTTFKGLNPQMVKRAVMEGVIRGFNFNDFLEKNIYAIPFKGGYSLITSIDYARKIGMRSGIAGKDAPIFEEKDNKIISCTVTVKKKTGSYVGDFTATVFFSEFYKAGKNGYPSLWDSKPHVMIAKVAEMHALRMACPEEMAQMYVEEEYQQQEAVLVFDSSEYETKLKGAKTLDELKRAWDSLPAPARTKEVMAIKDKMKIALQSPTVADETVEAIIEPKVDLEAVQANLDSQEPPFTPEETKAQEEFIEKEGIESVPF
jgi:hypothetical protein